MNRIVSITRMSRTQNSNYATKCLHNNDEKSTNIKYGKDGEKRFLKILNKKYPHYLWYAYRNNWESVDFYGIPNQEVDYNVKDNFYNIDGSNVEIVIELKSKRMLCDKNTQKTKSAQSKYKEYNSIFHFVNWSKYEDIKKRFKNNTTKRAFLVWDYMKYENDNNLSKYDEENCGNYYFHEITQKKIDDDARLEEWEDHESGRNYNVGWKQNPYRDVEDKVVNIVSEKVLPFKYFKNFLPNICRGADNDLEYKLWIRNTTILDAKRDCIEKNERLVKLHLEIEKEKKKIEWDYGVYVRKMKRKNETYDDWNTYYNENSSW